MCTRTHAHTLTHTHTHTHTHLLTLPQMHTHPVPQYTKNAYNNEYQSKKLAKRGGGR